MDVGLAGITLNGIGRWAWVAADGRQGAGRAGEWSSDDPEADNGAQRMALVAAIEALRSLSPDESVTLHLRSEGSIMLWIEAAQLKKSESHSLSHAREFTRLVQDRDSFQLQWSPVPVGESHVLVDQAEALARQT